MTIYAIGDIHGRLDLLRAAHDRVAADRAREGTGEAPLVHVGDLVDRGPDSAGVVGWLGALAAGDPRVVVLRGNHDAMFAAVLAGAPQVPLAAYLREGIGGAQTLLSYGIDPGLPEAAIRAALAERVPPAHAAFLAGLPLMYRAGGCLLVHAGIRPGVALAAQAAEDLLWIRQEFLADRRDHGALVVHGHTPVPEVELHPNRLAIDTGAAYGGPLSAVAIEPGGAVFLLTPAGRVAVPALP
jgi:serine/threonine protein phosphatase 1